MFKNKIHLVFLILFSLSALFFGCGGDSENRTEETSRSDIPYPDVPGNGLDVASSGKNLAVLQRRFSSAVIRPAPWAGFWWPYRSNGVTFALNKFDAVTGSSAASWEQGNHGSGLGDVPDWWGHCNGWAAAAVLEPEPRESKTISGITFNIADRKALFSETYMEVTGDFLGTRVNDPNDTSSAAFQDIVPAQFYFMITHVMGSQKRAFLMDRYTGFQVWNHPVVAYETSPVRPEDYVGADPQFPDVHRVNMTTRIWWVDNGVDPGVVTPEFDVAAPADVFDSRVLRYELWLDAAPEFDASGNLISSGNILLSQQNGRTIGGQWKNSGLPAVNSHPDYMWIPTGVSSSSGYKNPRIPDEWVLSNMR